MVIGVVARSVREDRAGVYVSLDKLIALAVFAISLVAPVRGLVLAIFLAPLGHLLAVAAGLRGACVTDTVAVAFIAGWLLRRLPDRPGPRVAAPLLGLFLCALVAASTAGVLWPTDGAGDNLIDGVRFVTGFALAASTVALFRQRPGLANTVPTVMAASASIAVLAPQVDARSAVADFALVSCLAIGMAVRSQGNRRLAWSAVSAWLAFGLAAAAMRAPHILSAFGQTRDLLDASQRVLVSRPLFGVGAGDYARTIPLFYSPSFSWSGGETGTHNLLAIGVELGLVGLGLWLAWIGAGLRRAMRALAIDRRDARLWGVTGGVAAFVAALAISRPLAHSETAFPFMFQFGLMTALAGSTVLNAAGESLRTHASPRQPWRRFAVAMLGVAAMVAGALISARQGPIEHPASPDVDGFYGWETSSSGERFRRAQEFASVFVPADVTRVRIPLRAPAERRDPAITVDIKTDGAVQPTARVNDDWNVVEIEGLQPSSTAGLRRIDLRSSDAGVHVGEVQFTRGSRPGRQ